MKLYFLRHGQGEHQITRVIPLDEITDTPLTELGVKEVEVSTDIIVGLGITAIYSSDYMRAQQTAGVVNEKLKLEIITDPRLCEVRMGELVGMPFGDIPADYYADPRKYGGENNHDMYARASAAINDIVAANAHDANVLISGHGFCNSFLMYCACEGTDKPFDEAKFQATYHKPVVNAAIRMVDMSAKLPRTVQFVYGEDRRDEDILLKKTESE